MIYLCKSSNQARAFWSSLKPEPYNYDTIPETVRGHATSTYGNTSIDD